MAGVDLRTVQPLGGWQSLAMVQRYAHLAPDHLRAAVERLVRAADRVELGQNLDLSTADRELARRAVVQDTDSVTRRGGRARLKASDSKSDRGASPSGVQILSPPPNSHLHEVLERRGGVAEWPKVRHWKCRVRATVPWVRIPPPPPFSSSPEVPMSLSVVEKGSAARRRPKVAREAYSLYVERAAEGANEADGPFSAAC